MQTVERVQDRTGRATAESRLATAGRWVARFDVLIVGVIVGVAVSTLQGNVQFLAATMAIYALFALSTNVLIGWHGTITFGQAAYFGGGAYFVAILRNWEAAPPLIILLAGLFGALLAAIFAVATTRVSGIAFAMLTLVFGQILYQLVFTIPELQGDNGIPGVPAGELFGVNLIKPQAFWWYALVVVGVCAYGLRHLYRSSFGQSVLAIRDEGIRAEALGVPVGNVRIWLVVIAGFFGAVAGGLFAQQQGIVTSDNLLWLTSGNVLLMCLVGGMRSFWGPVFGAVIFIWLNTKIFQSVDYSSLFVGLILLAVVLVFRRGVAGLPAQIVGVVSRLRRRRGER